jgi:hypothetical protein
MEPPQVVNCCPGGPAGAGEKKKKKKRKITQLWGWGSCRVHAGVQNASEREYSMGATIHWW